MLKFRKATREQSWLRLALVGPSGSGKTFTALLFARELGERVAVIDTERGSASKYADEVAAFDVLELESFAPAQYVAAIDAAAAESYPVLLIDSLSHAWNGRGGALEMVDKAAARSRSGNSFAAWREVTPEHHALVEAILRYPGHVLVTMRVKTSWVIQENDRGKKEPRKIGLAPVQRDGIEYEFDVVADLDHEHRMIVTKSRCPELADAVVMKPGSEVAQTLRGWLTNGVDRVGEASKALEAVETAEDLARAKELARRAYRIAYEEQKASLQRLVTEAEGRLEGGAS